MKTDQVGFRQVLWIAAGAVALSVLLSAALAYFLGLLGKPRTVPREKPIVVTGGSLGVSFSNEYIEEAENQFTGRGSKIGAITVHTNRNDESYYVYDGSVLTNAISVKITFKISPQETRVMTIQDLPDDDAVRLDFKRDLFRRHIWESGLGSYRKRVTFYFDQLEVMDITNAKPVPCKKNDETVITVCNGGAGMFGASPTIEIETK